MIEYTQKRKISLPNLLLIPAEPFGALHNPRGQRKFKRRAGPLSFAVSVAPWTGAFQTEDRGAEVKLQIFDHLAPDPSSRRIEPLDIKSCLVIRIQEKNKKINSLKLYLPLLTKNNLLIYINNIIRFNIDYLLNFIIVNYIQIKFNKGNLS
jgi:hypothetical protein